MAYIRRTNAARHDPALMMASLIAFTTPSMNAWSFDERAWTSSPDVASEQ